MVKLQGIKRSLSGNMQSLLWLKFSLHSCLTCLPHLELKDHPQCRKTKNCNFLSFKKLIYITDV